MAKIMLVEDDNNLREIYGERLIAEGYEIVSAKDGEEALALAVKEKPDLIISDVMMPKISGFDMLDILRQTPETKNTKVIMMTALSQAEDKQRANSLGADKYLVKSQVTLEDVARVVDDVLNDRSGPMQVPNAEQPPAVEQTSAEQQPAETTPIEVDASVPTDDAPAAPVLEMAPEPQPVAEPIAEVKQVVTEPESPASIPPTQNQENNPSSEAVAPTVTNSPSTEQSVADATVSGAPPVLATTASPQSQIVSPTTDSQAQTETVNQAVQEPSQEEQQPLNPMTAQTAEPVADPLAETSTASPESVEEKLSEINKEIDNFVHTEQAEVATHQVAMVEPTQAELEKAEMEASKNTNPDPTVIPPAAGSQNISEPASTRKKVINPIGSIDNAPNINELYEKELAAETKDQPVVNPGAGANIESPVVAQAEQPASTNPMLQSAESVARETVTVNTAPLETADLSQIEGLTTEVSDDDVEQTVATQLAQPPQDNTEASTVNTQAPTDQQPTNPNDPNNIAL